MITLHRVGEVDYANLDVKSVYISSDAVVIVGDSPTDYIILYDSVGKVIEEMVERVTELNAEVYRLENEAGPKHLSVDEVFKLGESQWGADELIRFRKEGLL